MRYRYYKKQRRPVNASTVESIKGKIEDKDVGVNISLYLVTDVLACTIYAYVCIYTCVFCCNSMYECFKGLRICVCLCGWVCLRARFQCCLFSFSYAPLGHSCY